MNDDLILRSALLADLREKGFLPAIVQRAIERASAEEYIPLDSEDDFCSYGERKEGAD